VNDEDDVSSALSQLRRRSAIALGALLLIVVVIALAIPGFGTATVDESPPSGQGAARIAPVRPDRQ
jgi:hypothetical protein